VGVCDAFRDAELLAIAVQDGLSGNRPLASALLEYERRRNEATSPAYELNLRRARFERPREDELRVRQALVGNQDAINKFFMAGEGMIPQDSCSNSRNLHATIEHGGVRKPQTLNARQLLVDREKIQGARFIRASPTPPTPSSPFLRRTSSRTRPVRRISVKQTRPAPRQRALYRLTGGWTDAVSDVPAGAAAILSGYAVTRSGVSSAIFWIGEYCSLSR